MNTNTEEWGNIELPGLSDEELFKRHWEAEARARERNNDPIYWKKLKNGLDKRSKSLWKDNNKKANQKTWKIEKNIESRKQGQRKANGYPVCAIDPTGKQYEFNSVAECSEIIGNPLLQSRPLTYFAKDGSRYIARRKKWKGWTFFRII